MTPLFRSLWLYGLACLGLLVGSVASQAQGAVPPADVRLVIDVSGSMKQTDPENLRRPALELLVRLLPQGGRAGVWTFGQEVNLLVPHGEVNRGWQKRALDSVPAVNSVALYTNIGLALEKASYDRERRDSDYNSHIILLTDGMVDVSPLADVNEHERRRIESQLVPEVASAGYRIHTIALSNQADRALLQRLARSTDGIYSQADDADQLLTSLVRILHQSVPADSVPMEDGGFLVDEGVREFTALIMRSAGSAPAALLAPDTRRFTSTANSSGVNWHSAEEYDLVTVRDPEPGQWNIDADMEPDSRVTVVSDLRLEVQPLPNHVTVNQPVTLAFSLRDKRETITDTRLLTLLDIDALITGPDDHVRRVSWEGAPPADGVYELKLPPLEASGDYYIDLVVDGKTFKRAFSHRLAVASLFAVELDKAIVDDRVSYTITVGGNPDRVNHAETSVVAHIKNSAGYTAVRALDSDDNHNWWISVTPEVPARYSIDLEVSGRRSDGQLLRETLPSQYFHFPEEGDPYVSPEDRALADLEADVEEEPVAEVPPPDPIADVDPVKQASPEATSSSWLLYGGVILANLLVVALIFFGYRMIKSSRQTAEVDADEEGASEDDQAPGEPPPMQDIVSEPEEEAKPDPQPKPPEGTPTERAEGDEALFPLGGEVDLEQEPDADPDSNQDSDSEQKERP